MSQLLNGSICLTDIPKGKITVSEKNGKKYLSINIWINDTPDSYGNHGSINIQQDKIERENKVKKTYIGNVKAAQISTNQPAQALPQKATIAEVVDDLPF